MSEILGGLLASLLALSVFILIIYIAIILPIQLKYKVVKDNNKNQVKILEQQQIIMNNYQNMQQYQQPYQTDIQERK